ncbi:MAG TPA: NADH-quinone oxidoreductase subunit NuoG [Solirubrobacteraceae bacterium]|nr:NADH-quinone oxidoreductase subunit NuoG [Solirubrobacteraceae bacterium]
MARPELKPITLTIDGREVNAGEGMMLADAAKLGDIEIPVFCYEPKLGEPVGACRMCLVEIEGMPKLQTACSTAVKDGMVVYTESERVRGAQRSVVEFLLINHPLDCPVCDKGGECPLQDISFGWGSGISRFIDPKRHFIKPLELSPLIAIDRERCILCYRCVRFSQEVAEDYQLVLLERGAASYVSTFDSHPYVAPFSGNIIELCPVGALTSRPYRFRARPWDIEGAGSVCTLCPAQCNVELTVRDERTLRVLARDNDAVDDGWLCDKGRFAYQSFDADERITQPLVRDGGQLRPVSWERALDEAAGALRRAGAASAAIAAGGTTGEEALLLARIVRDALRSPHLDSRRAGPLPLALQRALADPALQASVADLEFARAVLVLDADPRDDAPILDLRLRKGARRRGVKLALASPVPGALADRADLALAYDEGASATLLHALALALEGRDASRAAKEAGSDGKRVAALAELLQGDGEVVVLWHERLTAGPGGARAARELLAVAAVLGLADADGSGLLEIPAAANGRGLREAGLLPNAGPGYTDAPLAGGLDAAGIAAALASGELSALYLVGCDPLLDLPGRAEWERALDAATSVIAHAALLTDGLRESATVVFPAETYAEKDGTVVHPDSRLQRLRAAVQRPGAVRAGWQVLAELGARLGVATDVRSAAQASELLYDSVPFYAGLSVEEIGGRGARWSERSQATALPAGGPDEQADSPAAGLDRAELAGRRSLWDAPEVAVSPALEFTARPRELV